MLMCLFVLLTTKTNRKKGTKKKLLFFCCWQKISKQQRITPKKKKKYSQEEPIVGETFSKKKKKNTRGVMQTMLLTFQVSKSDLMWNLYDVKDMEEVFYVKPPKLGFKPFIEKGNMNSIGP